MLKSNQNTVQKKKGLKTLLVNLTPPPKQKTIGSKMLEITEAETINLLWILQKTLKLREVLQDRAEHVIHVLQIGITKVSKD